MTRALWSELFPDELWPGSDEAAVRMMADEIRALRLLADIIVTTAIEQVYPQRTRDEIQMAHDLIVQMVQDRSLFDSVFCKEHQETMLHNCDALCWVLRHDHNQTFGKNLEVIRARLASLGYEVLRYPEMQFPDR